MSEPRAGARPVLVQVADLLAAPGRRRELEGPRVLEELAVGGGAIAGDAVELQLTLEAQAGRIICSGEVRACWELECRRCLGPVNVPVAPAVTEVFEPVPAEGETFPLDGEVVDLAPMLREVVLLTLPLAPLCGESCGGPAGGSYYGAPPVEDPADLGERRDPRWAALDDFQP
ncbi:MAG: DUF177 domain-containing protein [bacterium]|nr:DUF177 domain-containing protein [bacterium]